MRHTFIFRMKIRVILLVVHLFILAVTSRVDHGIASPTRDRPDTAAIISTRMDCSRVFGRRVDFLNGAIG